MRHPTGPRAPHTRPTPARPVPTCAEKLIVVLRDGRKIIGVMRSFDQFANIVLEHAEERVIVGKRFADVPLGLYVLRGENVVLLGQIVRPLPHARRPLSHARVAARCPTRARARPRSLSHRVWARRTTPRRRPRSAP